MFARDRQEIGIGEIAQELGLHRSTTSRLAATLAVAGYQGAAGEPGGTACPVGSPRWSPPGATCARSVFDRTGTVVASISTSGPRLTHR